MYVLDRSVCSSDKHCTFVFNFLEYVLESFPPKIILLEKAKEERRKSSCQSLKEMSGFRSSSSHGGRLKSRDGSTGQYRANGVARVVEEESTRPVLGIPSGPAVVKKGECGGQVLRGLHPIAGPSGAVRAGTPTSLLPSLGADFVPHLGKDRMPVKKMSSRESKGRTGGKTARAAQGVLGYGMESTTGIELCCFQADEVCQPMSR